MQRRRFIAVLAGLLGGAALWPLRARAQNQASFDQAADNQIGQVGTLQGAAMVTRANAGPAALKLNDAVYRNDALETGANGSLSVTFDDESTFSLSANARIVIDQYVYQEGASGNKAAVNVARGTVAFVASLVAKSGDMTITTPTASLGIRGTTGVVDVPAAGGEAKIKLYADADGHVGQIQAFDRQGGRLGALTQGASAFAIRPGLGGRFTAVRFAISPQEAARDRGVVQRLFGAHRIGRPMAIQRRQLRGRNFRGPNNPRQRGGPQQQNRNLRGPQQQNRNLRGPQQQNRFQQPNRGQGRQQQGRGGLRDRLRKLNPFSRERSDGQR